MFAGEGYFFELLDGDGVGEEGDVGLAAVDLVDGFDGVAEITDVGWGAGFFSEVFGVDGEDLVEQQGVELGEVEGALALGQVGEGGLGLRAGAEKEGAGAGDGDEGSALMAAEQVNVAGGVSVGQGFKGEELLGGEGEGDGVEGRGVGKTLEDAVGGLDDEAVGVHVDEGHHGGGFRPLHGAILHGAALHGAGLKGEGSSGVGFLWGMGWGRGVFFGVGQGCLIAMVAVGEDEFFVGHGGGEQANGGRVADAPEAVKDAGIVSDLNVGGAASVVEDFFNAAGRVGVKHKDLIEVGAGGFE